MEDVPEIELTQVQDFEYFSGQDFIETKSREWFCQNLRNDLWYRFILYELL